jgi:Putative auto-transporter adhesin, head GIN domain
MKKIAITTLIAFFVVLGPLTAQEQQLPLSHFTRIVASPRVNVILQKGDKESVRMVYSNVNAGKVNIKVRGNTLRIYLDHARVTERQERMTINGNTQKHSIYRDASVTAYVTYRELKGLEIRGEEEISCDGEINTNKLKIKAYGESEIRLAGLNASKFKASLYGRNNLKIVGGTVKHQTFRSFGENKIDTRGMDSETASTRVYGEGRISVTTTDEIVINAFGEPEINVRGRGQVVKGIVIGRVDINARD